MSKQSKSQFGISQNPSFGLITDLIRRLNLLVLVFTTQICQSSAMASKSSTATLFSTYKASKIQRNYSRNGATSSRYIVGSVGKACGKLTKFGGTGGSGDGNSCSSSSHRNVAIATQVLNPSAIGGSLKNRRFAEHFGPKEDDEISFLSRRSRAVCSKVCYYGISIGVTMIMITGLIVAVGYMQTEKQRIATRPVKLAQGQDFESSTTHQPPAILFGTTTTIKPTVSLDTDNEIIDEVEDDDMDEISIHDFNNYKPGVFFQTVGTSTPSQTQHNHDIQSANDDDNNISDEYSHSKRPVTHFVNNENERDEELNTSPEEYEGSSKHQYHSSPLDEHNHGFEPNHETDRPFSEVRVKPPSDFKFEGISFEFPIYRTNTTNDDTHPTTTATATTDVDNDNEELHLNNTEEKDLDEIETESTSSASTQSTSGGSADQDETKELETSINHSNSNSGSNFTSLIDSQENNGHEELLYSNLDEKENYANANAPSPSQSQEEQINSSGSLFSEDFSKTKNSKSTGDTINILSHYNSFTKSSESDRPKSNSKNNGDDQIIVKTSSRFSSTKNQYDNTQHNNDDDFAIGEETTAVATLQTDLFLPDTDNEQFVTSASEESEIDSNDSGSLIRNDENKQERGTTTSTTTTRPKHINSNRNDNDKNRGGINDITILRPNSGPRRGKILRPPQSPSSSNLDTDYESEPANNRRPLKDGKKLSLRPTGHNKFRGTVNANIANSRGNILKQNIQVDLGTTSSRSQKQHLASGESDESLTLSNLDYKVDFSRFIPTTPAPSATPSPEPDSIEYQPPSFPSQNSSPYPDFKFSPPPLEHHKEFDLQEYLNKHAHKKVSTDTFDTSSASGPSPAIEFNQFQSYKVDPNTVSTAYTPTSGTGTLESSPASLALTQQLPQQDNQFSPQSPSTNFGSATPTGATLNLFQPQATYNYDSGGGGGNYGNYGTASNFNLPSFNSLSSSAASNAQHGFHVDANGAFSLTSPSNLPYPNIPTGPVAVADNLGSNYQNAYTFTNNEPSASASKNLILTTGAGQIPTYNTITQGIHLLTLLSGKNSDNGYQNSNNDQLSSGSSIFQNVAEMEYPSPQSEIQAGYNNGYDTNNWKNHLNSGGGNLHSSNFHYQNSQDFYPHKTFKSFDSSEDQDSSASVTIPSFSRSIVLKASDLKIGESVNKAIKSRGGSRGNFGATPNPLPKPPSQPKSLSITILPKANTKIDKKASLLPPRLTPATATVDSTELESIAPKSRKRILVDDMEVGESRPRNIFTSSKNNAPKSRTMIMGSSSVGGSGSLGGLKSGYFS